MRGPEMGTKDYGRFVGMLDSIAGRLLFNYRSLINRSLHAGGPVLQGAELCRYLKL